MKEETLEEKINEIKSEVESTPTTTPTIKNKPIHILIKEMERENLKTEVVRISMVDKKEAATATSAYFSTGNVAMKVPLDTYVEMPKILIQQAKEAKCIIGKKKGQETVPTESPKYVVAYK